jgi:hypothetical protein
LNTPSHHRVHHGSNLKYLDKNHGGILIIWDRLFGSFQPEEERPVYGLTKNIESFNPVVVALKTWKDLFQSAAKSGSIKNAVNYFIQPPGWSHDGSTKTAREMKREVHSSNLSLAAGSTNNKIYISGNGPSGTPCGKVFSRFAPLRLCVKLTCTKGLQDDEVSDTSKVS